MPALFLPPVIAHRGASLEAPENSLSALDKAAEAGARWVEFDVMLSADGVAVLHHYQTLMRLAGRPDAISQLSLSELMQVDIGSAFAPGYAGERIPTLVQAIERLGALGLGANIEIKPASGRQVETGLAVVAELDRHWPSHLPAPLISSFSREALAVVADRAPALPCGWLAERLTEDWQTVVARCRCASVHLGWEDLTAADAAAVKEAGLLLAVWTVNDPAVALRCRTWGADAIIRSEEHTSELQSRGHLVCRL